jgi:hypothetical protein
MASFSGRWSGFSRSPEAAIINAAKSAMPILSLELHNLERIVDAMGEVLKTKPKQKR